MFKILEAFTFGLDIHRECEKRKFEIFVVNGDSNGAFGREKIDNIKKKFYIFLGSTRFKLYFNSKIYLLYPFFFIFII